jgi:hypothetical protein
MTLRQASHFFNHDYNLYTCQRSLNLIKVRTSQHQARYPVIVVPVIVVPVIVVPVIVVPVIVVPVIVVIVLLHQIIQELHWRILIRLRLSLFYYFIATVFAQLLPTLIRPSLPLLLMTCFILAMYLFFCLLHQNLLGHHDPYLEAAL